MNDLIDARPSAAETFGRSYTKDQVESIKRELQLIKAFLKDVEEIEEPDAGLNYWEEVMRDIAHKAEAIIGTYENLRNASMETQYHIAEKISMITEKIQEITERRIAYGIKHVESSSIMTKRRYQKRPPSLYSEESVVIAFGDREDEIKERFLAVDEPRCCVISIVGMDASGKTTLVESIYNDNTAYYCTHAWVPVSEKHSAEEILHNIRKNVPGSNKKLKGKQSPKELQQMLHNFLSNKRYLIVLVNIYMAKVWDDIKDTFPDESNGSRIVFTTRDMDVAPHADSRVFKYILHLLNIDESSTLFTNTVNVPQELEKLGREIVMSCGGLPLAIVNMGKLLAETVATNETWSRVLNELKGNTGPWLEISYKVSRDLPLELKKCLHCFLLFPKEFDIPARRLIMLWVAEGF